QVGTQHAAALAPQGDQLVYKVHRGDYLGSIAERFGGTFASSTDLAKANHIKDPNLIVTGWDITLPEGGADPGPQHHATRHPVRPGVPGTTTTGDSGSGGPPTPTPTPPATPAPTHPTTPGSTAPSHAHPSPSAGASSHHAAGAPPVGGSTV